MNKIRFSGSALFGIVLIAVGVVSLLSSLNYLDSWYIFSNYWPLVVILFGVKSLVDHKSSTIFGIIVIGIGAFLQLEALGLWYLAGVDVREMIVPAVIILIGLYFILPKGRKKEVDVKEATEDAGIVVAAKTEEATVAETTEADQEVPAEEVPAEDIEIEGTDATAKEDEEAQ